MAQETFTDTLLLAQQLVSKGQYSTAIQLLQDFGQSNRENSGAKNLLAHTYYWSGQLKMAETTFQKAMLEHPDQPGLRLDYGRMLFETKDFKKAKTQFLSYLKSDPTNAEALLDLGYIHFWEEKYNTAETYFQQLLKFYPGQPEATKMLAEAKALRAVTVEINGDFQTDSQPLKSFQPSIKASQYRTQWMHPSLKVGAYFFETETEGHQSQYLELGNHFYFKKPTFDLVLNGGFYRNHVDQKISWLGNAVLEKQLAKGFSLSVHTKRTPNTTTLAALEQLVFLHEHSLQFQLLNGDSWMGQTAIVHKNHGDKNPILSAYAWGMCPALKVSIIQLRVGYAFSYADTKESRFRSEVPLSQIIDNWQEGQEIEGVYDPYFTPRSQQVHAALAYLKINLSRIINLECNGNMGFYAKSDIPFLSLDLVENELNLTEGFTETSKTTFDLGGKLNVQISGRTFLKIQYHYLKTFFYNAHNVGIGLTTNLNP